MKRRVFTKTLAATSLFAPSVFWSSCSKEKKALNILVLGGTQFVGPAIVNAALSHHHQVTLFNRGITNPSLFPNLQLIKGDREKGMEAYIPLLNKKWDVVIDVWPEQSRLVEDATKALELQAKHYIFISSIAVYNDFQEVGLHEESDVVTLNRDKTKWGYSEEKVAAENIVRQRFPNDHTILRPGPIKGWRDPAMDLLYWCLKIRRDEAIIAPGSGNDPIQFIDVKDIGWFTMFVLDHHLTGTYNCVGPQKASLLWKDFLPLVKNHFKSDTELVWASEDFLKTYQIASFSDLPLWAPLSEDRGFMQISPKKMLETGFELTSIETTLEDCINWHKQGGSSSIIFGNEDTGIGIERSRELGLLRQLQNQQ